MEGNYLLKFNSIYIILKIQLIKIRNFVAVIKYILKLLIIITDYTLVLIYLNGYLITIFTFLNTFLNTSLLAVILIIYL